MHLSSTRIKPPLPGDSSPTPSRFCNFLGRSAAAIALPFVMNSEQLQSEEKLRNNVVAFWKVAGVVISIALVSGGAWITHSSITAHLSNVTADAAHGDAEQVDDTAALPSESNEDSDAGANEPEASSQQPRSVVNHTLAEDHVFRFVHAGQPALTIGLNERDPAVVVFPDHEPHETDTLTDDNTVTRNDEDALMGDFDNPTNLPDGETQTLSISTSEISEKRQDRFTDEHGHVRVQVQGRNYQFFDSHGHPVHGFDRD